MMLSESGEWTRVDVRSVIIKNSAVESRATPNFFF